MAPGTNRMRTARQLHRLPHLAALALMLVALPCDSVTAQEPASPQRRLREAVTLNTSAAVERQFAVAQDLFSDGQWEAGVAAVTETAAANPDVLVPVTPGRYVAAQTYAQMILAGLPPEGRSEYRGRIDARAKQWLADGQREDAPLRRILREAFASSYGDNALFLLGERAWSRGDLDMARQLWTQLIPLAGQPVGERLDVLRYPDSGYNRAEIFARLALCSVMEGDRERATSEIATFGRLFPNTRAKLAGRDGVLHAILQDSLAASKTWQPVQRKSDVRTFAQTAERNAIVDEVVDIGIPAWTAPLSLTEGAAPESPLAPQPLSYHPLAADGRLFVSDGERIYGWKIDTGKPVWPVDDDDSAVIYPTVTAEPRATPEFTVGVPRHTLTLAEGRLFARLGSPVTILGDRALDRHESSIVCLDVARGEGKLVWKLSSQEIGPGWAFDGTPLIVEGRAYGVLRAGPPRSQSNVLALDAETGRILWNRQICSTIGNVDDRRLRITNTLLSYGGGRLYLSTDDGAIAAIEPDTGTTAWIATYERSENSSRGLLPCVYDDGIVFASPADSDETMAFDAASGVLLWSRRLRGGVEHMIGAGRGRLVVSGERLWALDARTGRPMWQLGFEDPVGHGYGRGLLAGDFVYWPTREEILLVDQESGAVRQRFRIAALHGEQGGNLTIAGGRLVVAKPRGITIYSPFGGPKPDGVELYSRRQ